MFRSCLLSGLALLSFFFAGSARAQTATLAGTLYDGATGTGLPFANVLLFRAGADSSLLKGTPTTENGAFQLTAVPPGRYTLRASVVGYQGLRRTLTVGQTDVALGRLPLRSVTRQLGAVTVTGERAVVQTDLNKQVINVAKDLTSVAGTAVDVLQNVPSVTVDQNGAVTLRGAESVQVLVDGKPSGLADGAAALAQIPAARIDRIEVVTNPSARYDAGGAGGVINIILKKETAAGLNGTAALNAGTRGKYNGTLALNQRRGAWNGFGSYDFRRERRWGESGLMQVTQGRDAAGLARTIEAQQQGDNVNRATGHTARLGLDWAPTATQTWTLSAQPRFGPNAQTENLRTQRLSQPAGQDAGSFARTNTQHGWNRAVDLSLDFRRTYPAARPTPDNTLPRDTAAAPANGPGNRAPGARPDGAPTGQSRGTAPGAMPGTTRRGPANMAEASPGAADRELTGSLVFTPSRNRSALEARTDSVAYIADRRPTFQQQVQDTRQQQGTARLDYLLPLPAWRGRVETGLKSTLRRFDLDNRFATLNPATATFEPNTARSNRFRYTEWVQAAYATAQRGLGPKWSAQAGLRAELTRTQGEQLTTGRTTTRRYLNLFPSATLAHDLTASQRLQFSGTRRINRPDVQALNPFFDAADPLNIRTGNPLLRPEYLTALELGHQWFRGRATLTSTLFWRQTRQQVQRFRTVDSSGVATNSFINLGRGTTRGAEFTLSTPLTRWWRLVATGSAFRQQLNGQQAGTVVNASGWVSTGRLSTTLSPTRRTDVQLTLTYRGPAVTAQGQRREIVFLEAGLSQRVGPGDRGTLTARVSDVGDTQVFRVTAQGENFRTNLRFKRETRIAWLGFAWRFGTEERAAQRLRKRGPADNEGGQTGGGDG